MQLCQPGAEMGPEQYSFASRLLRLAAGVIWGSRREIPGAVLLDNIYNLVRSPNYPSGDCHYLLRSCHQIDRVLRSGQNESGKRDAGVVFIALHVCVFPRSSVQFLMTSP
jgi:hypothetical protein